MEETRLRFALTLEVPSQDRKVPVAARSTSLINSCPRCANSLAGTWKIRRQFRGSQTDAKSTPMKPEPARTPEAARRSPALAQAVAAPVTRAAIFLVATLKLEALVALLPNGKSQQLAHLQVKASHQQTKDFRASAEDQRTLRLRASPGDPCRHPPSRTPRYNPGRNHAGG